MHKIWLLSYAIAPILFNVELAFLSSSSVVFSNLSAKAMHVGGGPVRGFFVCLGFFNFLFVHFKTGQSLRHELVDE